MRIQNVRMTNYKRFTNLQIADIPESARLVVLIGPNGTGKSSVFDAFHLKSRSRLNNFRLEGDRGNYYYKEDDVSPTPHTTAEVSESIDVQFHSVDPNAVEWATTFHIRSPYRNEADFQLDNLAPVKSASELERFVRIIDQDQAVSDNYKRLAWKRQMDLDGDAPDETTFGKYRECFLGELQAIMTDLFADPTLQLQDFGGMRDAGVFRFSKGTSKNFHYKNLSGGEKAAFDLLLDIFVKKNEYQDAIYCIDEPEAHLATALHGPLLEAALKLIPMQSQLWIATHSAGFVRKAYDILRQENSVVFLDFSGHDFDQEVTITPSSPNRSFWQTTYRVALDDLADLIAPNSVVLCEGSQEKAEKGFDAKCYNEIFSDDYPDTLFISRGGSGEVEKSSHLISVLQAVSKGSVVWRVIDRENMSEDARNEKIEEGLRVLRRREIENYLYDPEVLKTFLKLNEKEDLTGSILSKHKTLLSGQTKESADLKKVSRQIFEIIKKSTRIPYLGNTREEFALEHLVPALKKTESVYQELRDDIFPSQ